MRRLTAFTLVELLVVLAIIGVLMALLIPAVQAARESGRRTQCANNLRQIGLAVQQYENSQSILPAGNVTKSEGLCFADGTGSGTAVPSQDGMNWAIAILPYMEQKPVFESYDANAFNEAPQNRAARETFIAAYVCPSDQATSELSVPASGPGGRFALKLPYMPGSYKAMSGRSDGIGFLDSAEFTTYLREWRGAMHTVGLRSFTAERLRNVRDGLTQTLLVGESTTRTNPIWRTFWAYSYSHFSLSSATPQARTLTGNYDECAAADGVGNSQPCKRGWGSFHRGMNFVLCDGGVHFIAETVDPELFAQLATIDGQEIAALP